MSDRMTNAVIDLKAYADNLMQIHSMVGPEVKLMAVVKANAYGHGLVKIAEVACGSEANYLGIVSLGELKELRASYISKPILILNYLDYESIAEAIRLDASLTVMDMESIKKMSIKAQKLNKKVRIHLNLDSGMHRAGCEPSEVLPLAQAIAQDKNLELEGFFTHFAESENPNDDFTRKQLGIFQKSIDELTKHDVRPPLIHCANSAASITLPETYFNMVRPGLLAYGLNPLPKDHPKYINTEANFKPVLSLKTNIIHIRQIKAGQTVGYNRCWKASRSSIIALLPIGYGDGWRRSPRNNSKVLVNGKFAPIVGNISMDQITIDVTNVPGAKIGDEVVLIGEQGDNSITVDDIARSLDTINYEIVTSLLARVERKYIR